MALPSGATFDSAQGVYYAPDSLGKQTLFNPLTGETGPYTLSAAQQAAQQYNSAQESATQSAADAKAAQDKADTIAFLNDQGSQLKDLLGRTDTTLSHGIQSNEDNYNTELNKAQTSASRQIQDQNGAKQTALDTIRANAGTAFRSLGQIIGRAAGTGSSAYQEMLPNVLGRDTSSKSQGAAQTYGKNISNINDSEANTLADLLRQKKDNESNIRSTVEGTRQTINQQLADNAGKVAEAQGGGYAAIKSAETPYMQAITGSRNAVDNLFGQFHTGFTPTVANPNVDQYTTDRSVINAAQDPNNPDPTNPYTSLLRRKLQGAV